MKKPTKQQIALQTSWEAGRCYGEKIGKETAQKEYNDQIKKLDFEARIKLMTAAGQAFQAISHALNGDFHTQR